MITLFNLDGTILLWIQEYVRNIWFDPIMIGITTLGNVGAVWIVISIGLCIPKRTRKIGTTCIISLVLSVLINNVLLKNVIARPRPFMSMKPLIPLIPAPSDYSFPSGHSAASFACAWILYRKLPKKYGIPALILAILIALSRLYIGVHYPSDVLAGSVSGIIISYLSEIVMNQLFFREIRKSV